MKMKKYTLSLLISCALTANATPINDTPITDKPTVKVSKMNLPQVFQTTINSVPECIEYCVDGLSLYAIITPFGVVFYWTPNISHNSPDLLMMSHNTLYDTPLSEFDAVFGKAYVPFVESILQLATSIKSPVGGGRERHKNWGKYQSVAFKESTGLGHPASVILKMFDRGGLKPKGKVIKSGKDNIFIPCKTNGCLEEENSALGNSLQQENKMGGTPNQKASDWLSDFYNGKAMNTTPDMLNGFGGNMVNMNSVASNTGLSDFMRGIGQGVAGFGRIGGRLFCPINVTPFMPYYLSGLDALEWRMGYPISDWRYSTQVLNPFSNDGISTKVKDYIQLSKKRIALPAIKEYWGNIYPREGVLEHPWDSKRGAVITARAADIMVEDSGSTRIRYKPDNSNNGFGGWGKLFPISGETTPGQKAVACHKNIANTGITNNETGGYAWTFWRRYNCDMLTTGIHITTIKFAEPVCLTDKVPK